MLTRPLKLQILFDKDELQTVRLRGRLVKREVYVLSNKQCKMSDNWKADYVAVSPYKHDL